MKKIRTAHITAFLAAVFLVLFYNNRGYYNHDETDYYVNNHNNHETTNYDGSLNHETDYHDYDSNYASSFVGRLCLEWR